MRDISGIYGDKVAVTNTEISMTDTLRDEGGTKCIPGTFLVVEIAETFTNTGTSLTVKLQDSHNNSNWVDRLISETVLAADLIAGKKFFDHVGLPANLQEYRRIRLVPSGTLAGGTVTGYETPSRNAN
jgi:hypothetical protein